mgnify:CR=1 FL=1
MRKATLILLFLFIAVVLCTGYGAGQGPPGEKSENGESDKKEKPEGGGPMDRPALVETGEISSGVIAPESEFIGTVFYDDVSEVAAEMEGLVDIIYIDDGEAVKEGQNLVELDDELLIKSLQAKKASIKQTLTSLEQARVNFERAERLFKKGNISEQEYDDARFAALVLEDQAAALQAEVEITETELAKKTIYSPFDGIVIEKEAETGEWISTGGIIAILAKSDSMEVEVYVPQEILPFIQEGMNVKVFINGKEYNGSVSTVIPRGDINTRTFPVRLKLENPSGLFEGMEARVKLPSGAEREALMLPRNAVVNTYGQNFVFTVEQEQANQYAVEVIGYSGMEAGISSPQLKPGMTVITKGNSRVRPGQAVQVMGQGGGPPGTGMQKPGEDR